MTIMVGTCANCKLCGACSAYYICDMLVPLVLALCGLYATCTQCMAKRNNDRLRTMSIDMIQQKQSKLN